VRSEGEGSESFPIPSFLLQKAAILDVSAVILDESAVFLGLFTEILFLPAEWDLWFVVMAPLRLEFLSGIIRIPGEQVMISA